MQQIGHKINKVFNPKTDDLLRHPQERIEGIAQAILSECPGILCAQEAFDAVSADRLAHTLSYNGYTVLHDGGTGSLINSGLLFATRYPILDKKEIRFWKFANCEGDDQLACKGLLRVPIQVPIEGKSELRTVIVYTTHLQAQDGKKAEAARMAQLDGILSVIEEDAKRNPDVSILLAGDLNVSEMGYGGQQSGEYTRRERAFFTRFQDFVHLAYDPMTGRNRLSASDPAQGTFYNLADLSASVVEPGCFYDRVCPLTKEENKDPLQYQITIKRSMDRGLSDHLPVHCTIMWPPSANPTSILAGK